MKYEERIVKTETVDLTGNWDHDVQHVISLSLQLNNNNVADAQGWVSTRLETMGNYEAAVKREVVQKLTEKRVNNCPYGNDLESAFNDIFGDIFRRK